MSKRDTLDRMNLEPGDRVLVLREVREHRWPKDAYDHTSGDLTRYIVWDLGEDVQSTVVYSCQGLVPDYLSDQNGYEAHVLYKAFHELFEKLRIRLFPAKGDKVPQ